MALKYHNVRTYSQLCQRDFASQAECRRGEELALLERASEISNLQYQFRIILNYKPLVSITVDFVYREGNKWVFEDTKGVLTRDFRTKMAWLKAQKGIEIKLTGD